MRPGRGVGKAKPKLGAPALAVGLHRSNNTSFPVVGVGASAGGLEAFTQLLSHLPRRSGMAFVLVQHLAPRHESALTSLLSHATLIPVAEVKDNMVVERDRIYVIPPNVNMGILHGRLHLMPRSPQRQHLPIDFFFRSLAEERGNKAIGVILSGTASDGTNGIKAIKAEGGITFAQTAESAKYTDMPRNAIAAGCVDSVLTPEGIAKELTRIASHPYVRQGAALELAGPSKERDDELRKIFILLRASSGVDFSYYKHSTIKRRIKRRMMLHKCQTIKDYISRLQEDRLEVEALYQDILIHVTGFFRDPDVFKTLAHDIFPTIIKNRSSANPIRVWVPGCSSGEEVYSIAMCLVEVLGDSANSTEIQIFGTDISESALDKARTGIYPESITSEVNVERLRRFFVKTGRGYRINKLIRDVCVFARQDVNKDPPFSRLDLISCRNLLIYFGSILQRKVLPIFHYALKPAGYLLLGMSETIGGYSSLFALLDKKHKIYAKKPQGPRPALDFSRVSFAPEGGERSDNLSGEPEGRYDVQKDADRILISRYVPAGVLINSDMEILQFRGRTGNYLEPAAGQPTLSLAKMVREGLLPDLREAIQTAKKQDATVRKKAISVRRNGHLVDVNIEVIPVKGAAPLERYFLAMFEDAVSPDTKSGSPSRREPRRTSAREKAREERNADLREELAQTKSTLQSIIEEQETTNEELKSANEEILSSNEELQSTNEELETAKEELQSTNEELNTLNEELQNRNLELSTANNDLINLIASTSIPMLILGNDLRIRHFTPPAEKLLNLIPSDVGRPISDLKPNLLFNNLEQPIAEAIDSLVVREFEVQDNQGFWYSMRIRPYRTIENKLEGAVITWNDITTLKTNLQGTEKALSASAEHYQMLFERNLAGIFRVTQDGKFLETNTALARILGYDSVDSLKSVNAVSLFESKEKWEGFNARLKSAPNGTSIELSLRKIDGSEVWVLMNAFWVASKGASGGEIEGILLDISQRKKVEQSLTQFSSWLLESQETERKRISGDLHDATSATLVALIAKLGLMLKSTPPPDRKVGAALRECLKLARECAKEVRTVSYLLRPPMLDETGLPAALRWYVEGFSNRSGVHVDLELPADLGRLDKDVETALFRIVQESLTNIHLHSGSASANIRVALEDDQIVLEVVDNGKGMAPIAGDPAKESAGQTKPGVGILSMRERASQVGGKLEIKSGENGTTVLAILPAASPSPLAVE
jgi:two-component system CheB/CheR fusion protein